LDEGNFAAAEAILEAGADLHKGTISPIEKVKKIIKNLNVTLQFYTDLLDDPEDLLAQLEEAQQLLKKMET
jgi:hypothetical protein